MMDLAVVGLQNGGIRIINLTEPSNPQLVGKVRNQDGSDATLMPRDITVNATLGLAIASALDGVYVIDIRNPSDPRVLNKITQLPTSAVNPDGTPVMIRLDGNQALIEKNGVVYLANPTKGVKALNLGAGAKITCNSNGPCGP